MKNNTKSEKTTLIISVFSLIIALIMLLFSRVNGMIMWPVITIFFCDITIFCCSIKNFIKNKKIANFLILCGVFSVFVSVFKTFF
jgi:hypothetical protein